MRPHIFALVRHGHYEQPDDVPSALLPHPLTSRGVEQARALGEQLDRDAAMQHWTIDRRWDCSSALRAWQTANEAASTWQAIDATRRQTPVLSSTHRLVERNLGCAANLRVAEIEQIMERDPRYAAPPPGWKSSSHYRLPFWGAESLSEAGLRVAMHLRDLARERVHEKNEASLRVVVGHGAAFRWAAVHLGILQAHEVAALSMYHARPVYIEYSPDDEWRWHSGDWKRRKSGEQARD